jgi:phosphoserine aminotransferase
MVRPDADYLHICVNNTIYGTRFTPDNLPVVDGIPLIADMSSNILSEVYDVNKFGLIYAGAQKNMGPAGVCAVIIRKDLIGNAMDITPTMLNYQTHADKDSMFNTPPCYSIYICGLVYEWVKANGGVAGMEVINKEKAAKLYDFIDNSALFKGTVVPEARSLMNIPFITGDADMDAKFVKEAKAAGLENLKGHRSVGGMRASIYNAMPMAGVDALIDFMKKFELENK